MFKQSTSAQAHKRTSAQAHKRTSAQAHKRTSRFKGINASLWAITFATMLAYSCKKEAPKDSNKALHPTFSMSYSNLYHSFGGYTFYESGFDFEDQIIHQDPDPDAATQELNVKILYVGIALNAAQCQYRDVNHNVHNALGQANPDDGGITAANFFSQHSTYTAILDSILQHNGITVDPIDWLSTPVDFNGYYIVPGIHVPENAWNLTEEDAIIAMGIEIEPSFGDRDELYEEDFIPAYYPVNSGEECSIEVIVGYDDDFDDYDIHSLEEQLGAASYTIAVITGVEVENGEISSYKAITPRVYSDSINLAGSPGCELPSGLYTTSMIVTERWQRKGKSRVRAKYLFQDEPYIDYWVLRDKQKVKTLDKSYFNAPTTFTANLPHTGLPNYIPELGPIQYLPGTLVNSPGWHYSGSALGLHGMIVVYEHDWYGWPRFASLEINSSPTKKIRALVKMKQGWNYYCQAEIDSKDWCIKSHIVRGYYNNNSKFTFRAL